MQSHASPVFTATPSGVLMDGIPLAKAALNPLSPDVLRYVRRAEELLATVREGDWNNRTPHSTRDVPTLAKVQMLLALASPQPYPPLHKQARQELAKDDSDDSDDSDDEDDGEDGGSDNNGGNSDSSGSDDSGDEDFDNKHPRWPAGSPDSTGGEFRPKDGSFGTAPDSGNISADEIRSALTDDGNNSPSVKGPLYISPEDFMYGPATAVALSDGSFVQNPYTGGNLQMPAYASLQDNVSIGESMANLPSILTDNDPFHDPAFDGPMITPDIEASPNITPTKEAAMILQFYRGYPMDYQRTYPTLEGKPNPAYVDFGNYNYGVVAAAAGYTLDQALYAAALVNSSNVGNPHVDTSGPNNSNPRNNYFIQTGYNDYKSGKIKGSK